MARIIPFKAVRPAPDKAHLVATRSYVSYSPTGLKRKLAENPFSFIHVINPEFSLNQKHQKGKARFRLVRKNYERFLTEGILQQEEKPAIYLYRQIQPQHSFVGLIAGISIDDYQNGTIKIHEQTITRRERLFKDYLDVCNFNAEPVLLTYPDDDLIENTVNHHLSTPPVYDFSTTDGLRHQLWTVQDEAALTRISAQFAAKSCIYIADGHHRSASSSLLGIERRQKNQSHTGNEMYNYLMACLIPESQLRIYDYNRVVNDLNGHSYDTFMNLLNEDFEIILTNTAAPPDQLHSFSMYLNGQWFSLRLRNVPISASPVDSLDAEILSKLVLQKHLGIHDPKTDPRIEFVSGKVGMDGLQMYADKKKMQLAFALFPVTTTQLKAVADADQIMPPKTTWIEPKLRSGLTIFSFDE